MAIRSILDTSQFFSNATLLFSNLTSSSFSFFLLLLF